MITVFARFSMVLAIVTPAYARDQAPARNWPGCCIEAIAQSLREAIEKQHSEMIDRLNSSTRGDDVTQMERYIRQQPLLRSR